MATFVIYDGDDVRPSRLTDGNNTEMINNNRGKMGENPLVYIFTLRFSRFGVGWVAGYVLSEEMYGVFLPSS